MSSRPLAERAEAGKGEGTRRAQWCESDLLKCEL